MQSTGSSGQSFVHPTSKMEIILKAWKTPKVPEIPVTPVFKRIFASVVVFLFLFSSGLNFNAIPAAMFCIQDLRNSSHQSNFHQWNIPSNDEGSEIRNIPSNDEGSGIPNISSYVKDSGIPNIPSYVEDSGIRSNIFASYNWLSPVVILPILLLCRSGGAEWVKNRKIFWTKIKMNFEKFSRFFSSQEFFKESQNFSFHL